MTQKGSHAKPKANFKRQTSKVPFQFLPGTPPGRPVGLHDSVFAREERSNLLQCGNSIFSAATQGVNVKIRDPLINVHFQLGPIQREASAVSGLFRLDVMSFGHNPCKNPQEPTQSIGFYTRRDLPRLHLDGEGLLIVPLLQDFHDLLRKAAPHLSNATF